MRYQRIKWKDADGVHQGASCGVVHDSDSDKTYLVVACEDGTVRKVNIDDIKPE